MKNPMNKRIVRELRHDIGKYLVIFLFLLLMISLVSGFLVADNSFAEIYNNGFIDQKIEDGHLSLDKEAPDAVLMSLEEEGNVTIYPFYYFEENIQDSEKNIRVYRTEREVNLLCLMSGEMPVAENEIALDRMFAENNDIAVGDFITLKGKKLQVSGLIASPDYSCLYENNSDMMFDSINFSIAVMSESGWSAIDSSHICYNYAWLYPEFIERTDTETAKTKSDDLIEVIETVLTDYNTQVLTTGASETQMLSITDYLPRYLNQAINFTGDDMGSDKAMILMIDYIITVILAFVFAITTSSTISAEAGVIGTLRATGYTKCEILIHYMILPVFVSLAAAVVGNILGYTVGSRFFVDFYYGSYSLATYKTLWNAEAFCLTTVIPLVMMVLVNLFILMRKLRLTPLQFLRHDLTTRKKKKSFRLPTKIPFLHRFRLRILFQNIPHYITLFLGILIGGVLLIFGTMFGPLLEDYKELIIADRICDYQYILAEQVETTDEYAEKYCLTSLKTTDETYMEDTISIYGIEPDSNYVFAQLSDEMVTVASSMAEKYNLSIGDTIELKDPYNEKKRYAFLVGAIYDYNAGIAIFMPKETYNKTFEENESYFTGYFSNREITDMDEDAIASVITISDLTKTSDQLTVSVGEMMEIFGGVGILLFILLMFLMSKQIIEKNAMSISMTKILGFSNGEIGGLYILATSIVVVISLLISIPLIDRILRWIFEFYLYTMVTGYFPFILSNTCYIKMVIIGVVCYALVSIIQMIKIGRISKSDALKYGE